MQNKILILIVTLFLSPFLFAKEKNTETFQKPIKKHLVEIKACSKEAANKVSGKVVVDLEINDNASLHRIKINEAGTTVQDLNIQKCVVDILKKVKYPKAEKSKTVAFSYSVEF